MRAAIHPLNAQRLDALRSYDILKGSDEADLNEIVELASEICGVPVSLISLVEEDHQWFKSKVGTDITQTPIEDAICAHTILDDTLTEIPDTLADPRTLDNALCTGDEGFRFYAGAPLIAANGMPLGTLCVLDTEPRQLTDLQRKSLTILSRQVIKQLDLRIALRNQEILQSEADHRVKNSLQSMSAIVRVYTRTITDEAALEALQAIQRRIDAVATLHLELQGTDGRDTIDTGAYLDRVLALIAETAPENISFTSDIASIIMRSDHAANLAMIIGEFVANSIKHAFPGGKEGEISVALRVKDTGQYQLECTDNGVGQQAETVAPTRTSGIGLSLVSAATSNLGGTTAADLTPDGSHLVVNFGDTPVEQTIRHPSQHSPEQSAPAAE